MAIADMTLGDMVQKYIKIRDVKDAAKKAFDTETKRMTDALAKLEDAILVRLAEENAESFVTPAGTAYRLVRTSVSVKDREAFYQFAIDNNQLGAIDMKANSKAVRELLEQGIEVPGVNVSQSIQIGVRRKS